MTGLKLKIVGEEDYEQVLMLYKEALGTEGCVWNENYPSEVLLAEDIKQQDLYGLYDESDCLIAAIAKDRDAEVDALPFWSKTAQPAAEIARVVVAQTHKNRGIARLMMKQFLEVLRERGFMSAHYLVASQNEPAKRAYQALNFSMVGETDLFGHHYFCYEKKLQ